MADVFISYKREDRPQAERLSIVLEQLGFEVWWDFDLLSGDPYRQVIRAVIDQCKAAIVLWSERAVLSDFVIDEAEYAKQQGKLCPVRIDSVPLPFGFGTLHTDDLSKWDGELFHTEFQNLVRAVEGRVGKKGRFGGAKLPQEAQAAAAELESFKAAQLAGNESALRAFVARHPQGAFASFVRSQLEAMVAETKARELAAAEVARREPAPAAPISPPPHPRPRPRARVAPKVHAPEPAPVVDAPKQPALSPLSKLAAPAPKTSRLPLMVGGAILAAVVLVALGGYAMMRQVASARQGEQDAYAARFAGAWAPEGLSCQDSSMRIAAGGGVFTLTPAGGAPVTDQISSVTPNGDLVIQSDDGARYVYRLSGDTLTRQSPDGETATMNRCPA